MSEKDYAKITEVSKAFSEWMNKYRLDNPDPRTANTEILLWQAKFELIIAQQLSIVAKHLGKIVGKAEELNDKDRNGST